MSGKTLITMAADTIRGTMSNVFKANLDGAGELFSVLKRFEPDESSRVQNPSLSIKGRSARSELKWLSLPIIHPP
jgi:hypothetical protein